MKRLAVLILTLMIVFLPGCRTDPGKTVTVTSSSFEETVLRNKLPVLVDFWFEDCVYCKRMEPVIRELSIEFEGKVVVAKVNIDDYPELPKLYDVGGYPTFLIFKDGQLKRRLIGMQPKHFLSDLLGTMQ